MQSDMQWYKLEVGKLMINHMINHLKILVIKKFE